jgi:hypothetical protein
MRDFVAVSLFPGYLGSRAETLVGSALIASQVPESTCAPLSLISLPIEARFEYQSSTSARKAAINCTTLSIPRE